MVATYEVPETVVAGGMVGTFKPQDGPKKAMQGSLPKKEEESHLRSWSSQVLNPR